MAESEEELKSLLLKVKGESEKAGLKLNIQKTKIMASGPITSWQIDGETIETVRDFIFLGSKITADGDCSHEIKSHLLLRRKAMTNLDSILKSRNITLLTKVRLVKAMAFPVVGTIKKAEHWWTDAFELWCWKRFLRVPWTARISNQSILKEINPEYSLQDWCWSSSTLATWCEGLTHWKDPDARKDWGQEEKGQQRMKWLDGITNSMHMTLSKFQEMGRTGKPGVLQSMGSQREGHN